jgi:hypothetical protein
MRGQSQIPPRVVFAFAILAAWPGHFEAAADESGVSFWLPGQYGSFAAEPSNPGWSIETTFYRWSPSAQAGVSFQRGGGIQVGMKSPTDLAMLTPTYAFETPVLGWQAAIGMTALVGKNTTSVTATLTGPGGGTLFGTHADSITAVGDLYPTATLKWNRDTHNFMLYATTGVPVGAYNPNRIAGLGLGHWAVDGGAGYTYYNEKAGFEFSVVTGLTYNFTNPDTHYTSGIDAHLDWSISPYVSDKMLIGAVGYFYKQLTGDSGSGATLGDFKSRVAGIGPQIGFFIPFGDREGFLSFKAYSEFNAKNRLEGWNGWITLSIDAPERKSPIGRLRQ